MKIIKFPQKSKVSSLKIRNDVQIYSIPFSWKTNLNDDEIKELYNILLKEQFFINPPELDFGKTSIKLSTPAICQIDFRGKVCRVIKFRESITAINRPSEEWELTDEIEIQKEKNKKKKRKRKEDIETKIRSFTYKGLSLLDRGDFQEAEQVLRDAFKIKLKYPNYNGIFNWTPEKFLLRLFYLSKNVEAGLTFLSEYEYLDYVEFGCYFEVDGNIDSAALIYQKAIQINPDNEGAYKRICIMYERSERYDEAIEFCQLAIKRGLSDMTKGGFEGRMKRIKKKAKKMLTKKI